MKPKTPVFLALGMVTMLAIGFANWLLPAPPDRHERNSAKESPAVATKNQSSEGVPLVEPKLKVVGIIASAQPTDSVALISVDDAKASVKRVGDTVSGWRIARISDSAIDLEFSGISKRLPVESGVPPSASNRLPQMETSLGSKGKLPAKPADYPGAIVSGKPGLD